MVSDKSGQRGSVCVVDAKRGERVRDISILLAKMCVWWLLVQFCVWDWWANEIENSHKVDESE